jgi:crotonobetainyl-CoA:carnitine CoA-transferase CaiB-like acyl-CoA transferase
MPSDLAGLLVVSLEQAVAAPYGVYEGSDGKPVLISIQNAREWATFCEAILRPVGAQPRDAMAERLRDARFAYGRVSDLADMHTHPQARHVWSGAGTGRAFRCLARGVRSLTRQWPRDQPAIGPRRRNRWRPWPNWAYIWRYMTSPTPRSG